MAADMFSSPSTSDIYATAIPTSVSCEHPSLGGPTATDCTTPIFSDVESEAWFAGGWTNPAAWLIIVYCVASACVLLLLMCHGYLDGHLNLDFSHAAAAQRELRRRRRNSRRMENWLEVERREARELEMGIEEENERAAQQWPGFRQRGSHEEHEQPPTLYPALDALQRQAVYERQVRDATVLARLERAGLF